MKKYERPQCEIEVLYLEDAIMSSGIVLESGNAGFNNADEIL